MRNVKIKFLGMIRITIVFTVPEINYTIRFCISTKSTTVDGERFAGLNIHGFSAIEVFTEIFLHCLGYKQCISTHYLV